MYKNGAHITLDIRSVFIMMILTFPLIFFDAILQILLSIFFKPLVGKDGMVFGFKEIANGISRFQIVAVDALIFVSVCHGIGVDEGISAFAPVVDLIDRIGGIAKSGAEVTAIVTGLDHTSMPASFMSILLNSSAVL